MSLHWQWRFTKMFCTAVHNGKRQKHTYLLTQSTHTHYNLSSCNQSAKMLNWSLSFQYTNYRVITTAGNIINFYLTVWSITCLYPHSPWTCILFPCKWYYSQLSSINSLAITVITHLPPTHVFPLFPHPISPLPLQLHFTISHCLHSHLMSLCMMPSECKCLRPVSTPRRMYLALPRTRPARSLSSLNSKK